MKTKEIYIMHNTDYDRNDDGDTPWNCEESEEDNWSHEDIYRKSSNDNNYNYDNNSTPKNYYNDGGKDIGWGD